MPAYQVTGPDGKKYKVDAPEGASADDAIAYVYNTYYVSKQAEPERTIGGYAKEALKGLVPGAVSGIETAITGAAALLPEEAERAVREKVSGISEPVREAFAPAPGYEDTTVRRLSEAVGSTAPFLGAGLLGAAGRAAAVGLGVATGAGEARQRAEEETATEGERAVATALGIAPGALEALPPIRILRRFGFGDEAIEEVAGLAPALKRVAQAGGEEALQEASGQVLQNLIAKGVYKPEEAVFGGVSEAAALGGGAGAIIGAIAELALGRRLRGTEPPPERREEEAPPAPPEEPTEPTESAEQLALPAPRTAGYKVDSAGNVVPITEAEAEEQSRISSEFRALGLGEAEALAARMQEGRRRSEEAAGRRRPLGEEDQMGLDLEGGFAQPDLFAPEPGQPATGVYRPAEEALAGLRPRSRAYKEEAKDLGLRLDKKGNLKPNQFVPEITAQVSPDQERFEFEEQKQLPLTQPAPFEGQGDLFAEEPIPARGLTRQDLAGNSQVTWLAEQEAAAAAQGKQFSLDLPGIPMDRLTPRDRVLRAMAITEDKKNIPNLKFATQLRPMELQKALGDLKNEGAISFNKQANEWELTPAGAESVRSGPEVKPARPRRRAVVPVQPSGAKAPAAAAAGERRVAGVGAPPARTDVREGQVPPALTLEQKQAREAAIRRAQEQRVARSAINEVEGRRSRLRTQAIDAFENDQIDENVYTQITEQLKRPVPNFGMVEKVLSGEVKPGRRGIKFQRGEVGAGLPVERVQAAANDAVRGWTNAPKIVVASSANDPVIPEALRADIPKDSPGFYRSGTTYVIADRAKDAESVRGTVFHESLGHYGLEQEFQGGLRDVMQGIFNTNPKMQAAAKERMEKFELDAPTAVEEVLAERSEAGPIKESWLRDAFNRVAAYIRNFLRQRGFVSKYSDNDVSQILRQAHRRVTDLKKAPYDPFNPAVRYQRSPEAQRRGDRAFVNAVGKIPQNLPVATKETLDTARNVASNLPSATRRALYSFYDPHEMGRIYSKDLKSDALEKLWKNANQEGAELRKMQEVIMDNMTKWNKVMEKYSDAERERIFNLFMDTTVTKIQIPVTDAKGKTKLKEVTGVEVLNFVDPSRNVNWKADDHPLAKQFARLDKPVQDFYKELRLSYVDNALAVEKQLQKYLTPTEWQKILNKLNEQRIRVYLPLFREGKFKLSYTDKNGNPVALQFETSRERDVAERELLREGIDRNSIKASRIEDREVQNIPPSSFLADIVADLTEAKVDNDTINGIIEHYLDYLPAESVLQRGRRRGGVAGYSNDVLKAYANVADSYARRVVKMEFTPKYQELQEEFRAAVFSARDRGDITRDVAEDLDNYVENYIDFTRNPNLDNWGAKLGYVSFQLYLGANISTAVTNVIDTPTVMFSRLLGKGHSVGSVGNALLNAGSVFFSKQKSPEMQELLQRGLDTGIIREQRLQDIAEFKNLNSRWEKLKANVDRISSWAFAKSDIFNREVGLIAAYNLQKAKNKTEPGVFDPKAFEVAESVVADVYGSSFPKATAPIMGSDIAKTALTFKRFGIKRINLLQAAYKEATRDLDPNDPDSKIIRDAARKEIIGYFGTAFVSAGVQGMPLVGAGAALVTVLNGILGDDDEPYDADFALREAVGLFAYKGPINYLLGIDIASRTGWTGMFWREDPKRMAEVGPVTYAVEQALGPAYAYAVGVPRAFDFISDGNYQRAFEQLMPRAISNVSKGFRYGTEGALTANGVPLVDDVNAYNTFMQIFGFRPSDVAEAGDIAGATKRMESKIFQRRNAIIARAAVARMSGDVEGFQEAVREAAEFSRKYPAIGISPETVYDAVQRRVKKLAMSVNGVTVNPKVARGIYEELGVTEEIE